VKKYHAFQIGLSTRRTPVADARTVGGDLQVAAPQDREAMRYQRRASDPIVSITSFGVGVVAELLGQLAALGVEHHAVAHDVAT
jgi:hypothetical protein